MISAKVGDGYWYGGTPIYGCWLNSSRYWVPAFFWVSSEAPVKVILLTIYNFNDRVGIESQRIETVKNYLLLPEEVRPHLIIFTWMNLITPGMLMDLMHRKPLRQYRSRFDSVWTAKLWLQLVLPRKLCGSIRSWYDGGRPWTSGCTCCNRSATIHYTFPVLRWDCMQRIKKIFCLFMSNWKGRMVIA